ncbi:hypothetical protein BD324DRAFT_153314 [Kockovaella imperatae]|uniref:Uncharacterized protein n=1 Tax=Kockovaella imperatae TaxID=4999 RepID=A0A1Y1U8V9_9TREE|nr:hypothetical protein BD324DRAFT_153314 [Kockovaella imperatae]ORX34480.1 hypothetical protein BD324DRAFT_153314 [Kockovaella imperatae]
MSIPHLIPPANLIDHSLSPYLTPPPTLPHTRANSDGSIGHRRSLTLKPIVSPMTAISPGRPNAFRLPSLPSLPIIRRLSGPEDDGDDAHSPNPRGDKRRRVGRPARHSESALVSPSKSQHSYPSPSPTSPHAHAAAGGRFGLAPIKPVGFAASRGSRREDGTDLAIPSPVVMGFDFKSIDDDQLRTVRDTISIKEQQQALIAQRRRENAASTPSTPKELTFKGWVPKESMQGSGEKPPVQQLHPQPDLTAQPLSIPALGSGGGVGRRREKIRDKVEGMTIVTSATDKDGVPGSKSAPLNQGLSVQQAMHDHLGGPQTSFPHAASAHHPAYTSDLRTAPISHARGSRDDHELARQQQGPTGYWRTQPRAGYERYEHAPHTGRPSVAGQASSSSHNIIHPPPLTRGEHPASSTHPRNGHAHYGSHSPSPPPLSASRPGYGPPSSTSEYYDMYAKIEQLKYSLQDLHHRYEGLFSSQVHAMGEFKTTAAQANALLSNLQASADSLKEMVRYEVGRSGSAERKELDELKERIKILEVQLKQK